MRRRFMGLAALVAGIAATGCATIENLAFTTWTPMLVAEWTTPPDGPFRAREGDRILTQYLTPSLVVRLEDDARPLGFRAPAAADAGARLFGVVDSRGVTRYCAAGQGRQLTCYEDSDGDSKFDRAWSAVAHDDFALSVRRWTGRRALAVPASYVGSDPLAGPHQQVAIRYLGRSRDRYGFALQVGGPDAFADVAWTDRAAWIAPNAEGALEFAGARLTVLDTSRRGDLIYSLQSAMNAGPLTLQVSTATRTLDSLVVLEAPSA
jgi:hypothetical protein